MIPLQQAHYHAYVIDCHLIVVKCEIITEDLLEEEDPSP